MTSLLKLSHPAVHMHNRCGAEAKLRHPDDETIMDKQENIHTSFSKLLLIGSAHLRQLNMMVKKKIPAVLTHALAGCMCVSLVFYSYEAV